MINAENSQKPQSPFSTPYAGAPLKVRPRTVYIDCSSAFHTGLNTGIQRVVWNIVNRSDSLSKTLGVPCIPVVFANGRAWAIRNSSSAKGFGLKRMVDRAIRRLLKLLRAVSALKRRVGGPHALGHSMWSLVQVLAFRLSIKSLRLVDIAPGDLLLAADVFWTHNVTSYLEDLSRRGVPIVSIIYDLIPVTHKEYVDDNNTKNFLACLDRVLSISDGVLGISKTVQQGVISYLSKKNNWAHKKIPVDYFYLGADLGNEKREKKKSHAIRKWPKALWQSREVYLMVGTLEPRKGYDFVLDTFEKMWAEGSNARLLIIGRIGWKCDDLMTRLKDSPSRGSRLFVYHDINDDELIYCYRQASAVILASRVEGFGLPLVEAMESGLPVLASDIPIFREIGGDYPLYFSLDSMDSLREALCLLLHKRYERRHWISWDESVSTLMKKVLSLYQLQLSEQYQDIELKSNVISSEKR